MNELDGNYNVALDLLDLELIDVSERACGRIDDLELEGEPGGELVITALHVGRGAWRSRVPGWLGWIGRGPSVRLPWEAVIEIGASVKLKDTERELGLNGGERRLGDWLSRIPGS
jgi:hypothetical protein